MPKSNFMIVRSNDDRKAAFPEFKLCGEVLRICIETAYFQHIFIENKKDYKDIFRQCRKLYAPGNILEYFICAHLMLKLLSLWHTVQPYILLNFGVNLKSIV